MEFKPEEHNIQEKPDIVQSGEEDTKRPRYWVGSYLGQWSKTMNEMQTLAAGMQCPHAKVQARD